MTQLSLCLGGMVDMIELLIDSEPLAAEDPERLVLCKKLQVVI